MLSVCIIAKNEEKNIEKCLSSLQPLQAELVVVDTGSTDQTAEIARSYGARVYSMPWQGDFSQARNYGIEKAENDWILVLDCDEYLAEESLECFGEGISEETQKHFGEGMFGKNIVDTYLRGHEQEIGMVTIRNLFQKQKKEEVWQPVGRVFHRQFYQYTGRVHEQLTPKNKAAEPRYYQLPLQLMHTGYDLTKAEAAEKAVRNRSLLEIELSEALEQDRQEALPYLYYQIGKTWQMCEQEEPAKAAFEQALAYDINPELEYVQDLVESWGYSLLRLKQFEDVEALEGVYEAFAQNADFLFLMGLLYMNQGRFQEAIGEFEKARSLPTCKAQGVNSYKASYNIGVIYECLGNIESALAYYRACGAYEPAEARLGALGELSKHQPVAKTTAEPEANHLLAVETTAEPEAKHQQMEENQSSDYIRKKYNPPLLHFPKEFFQDEVREGFYVSGLMKRFWAAQMEVLADVAELCARHKIPWFADYGTLLGAVRHGGFIPWDDDLDICMLRRDYDRFREIARRELPANYSVMDAQSDEYWSQVIRITSARDIAVGEEYLQKYHDFPYPAGIDIFGLDNISDDPFEEQERSKLAKLVMTTAESCDFTLPLSEDVKEILSLIEQMTKRPIDLQGHIKKQLFATGEELYRSFEGQETRDVGQMNFWLDYGNHRYPKDYFGGNYRMPFEIMEIPVPQYPIGKLKADYGNFMRLDRKGGIHDYPLYQHNEDLFREYLKGKYPFIYELQPSDLQNPVREQWQQAEQSLVLFVSCRAKDWKYLQPYYEAYKDRGYEVAVLVVPYYYRNMLGEFEEEVFEGEQYPEGLKMLDYRTFSLETLALHPDCIITQIGHDACNYTTSVAPAYYTSRLKGYTKQLIYVSPYHTGHYEPGDFKMKASMEHYVMLPAMAHADVVVVPTENLREAYVTYLTERTDEAYRTMWEQKLQVEECFMRDIRKVEEVQSSTMVQCALGENTSDESTSDESTSDERTLDKSNTNESTPDKNTSASKGMVLVYISSGTFAYHGQHAIAKIKRAFRIIDRENPPFAVRWLLPVREQRYLDAQFPKTWEAILEAQRILSTLRPGEGDFLEQIEAQDCILGYYGEESPYIKEMRKRGVPAMLIDFASDVSTNME